MGVVYRAVREETANEVALKTVDVLREGRLGGIRREIQSLSRLRHPGIVRVLAEGVSEGMPWYAMELLAGMTLRQLIDRARGADVASDDEARRPTERLPERGRDSWWTTALAPPRDRAWSAPRGSSSSSAAAPRGAALMKLLTLVRRLCAPLAFLHGEGFVHRDLKPDNVLVRADGTPVLLDFGLTSQIDLAASRAALEMSGDVVGTAAYMSPEQARGEIVDARADLYSLGCILYEIVTGVVPFDGTPLEMVWRHVNEAPRPPSDRAADLPAPLDALVLSLLAKNPRRRLGHAGMVALRLGEHGAGNGWPTGGPRPRAYLYRAELAGRAAPLQRCREWLHELRRGHGRIACVAGESGVGKTRLVAELGAVAGTQGVIAVAGECSPLPAAAAALGAWRRPLERIADRWRETGAPFPSTAAKILAHHVPAFADLPGVMELPEPVVLPAPAARLRVSDALTAVIAAVTATAPVLLVLDDVQWADDLSLALLASLARWPALPVARLLVVATYRPEDLGEERAATLRALASETLRLERLDASAVATVTAEMLGGDSAPAALAEFLAGESEGNPLFVAEYLRLAVEEGLLARDADGRWRGVDGEGAAAARLLALPSSIRGLLARRLAALGTDARRLVDAAAVVGRESDPADLRAIAGLDEEAANVAARQLVARAVMDETSAGRLRFQHDKIREVAAAALDAASSRALHRAAALAIEARTLAPDERGALAEHWQRSGEPGRAAPHYLAAARHAVATYALATAESFYRSYLAVAPPSPERIAARIALATEVLRVGGRMVQALAEAELARREAVAAGDRAGEAGCLWAVATMQRIVGRWDEAMANFEQALAIHRELPSPREEAADLRGMAAIHADRGTLDEAEKLMHESLAIQRRIGDEAGEALTLDNLGNVMKLAGRLDEARVLYERTLAIHRARAERLREGIVLGNLAALHTACGRPAEAAPLFAQALAIHREVGNRQFEADALGNLATLRYHEGRVAESASLYRQALDVYRAIGDRQVESVMAGNLGNLLLYLGEIDDAEALYRSALDTLEELGDNHSAGIAHGNLGTLRHERGDHDGAARCFERALALLMACGDRLSEGVVRAAYGRHLQESGDPGEAVRQLDLAIEQCRGNPRGEAIAHAFRGAALVDRGALSEAGRDLERAEELLRSTGDRLELVRVFALRAKLARATGSDAEPALREARALADLLGIPRRGPLGRSIAEIE